VASGLNILASAWVRGNTGGEVLTEFLSIATWSMSGVGVVPKADGYSILIEIVNPTDIQNLDVERYVQWLALGDTTWNVE